MTTLLEEDVQALEQSLQSGDDRIEVSLSRETAALVARIAKAKAEGQEVVTLRGYDEVSPAEAGALLRMSRPQVRKLMDRGLLPYRMVGTHHRIPVAGMKRYVAEQRERRATALAELAELQNDLGLLE
ncbi:MAG: helix-turn-helix domain-containing protein [Propionibacteriaceae bacterium]|jgi:excisionase family DNA binding protein|nr:helix-turn-helix domain-containing protein [Propionibacteriaceae bacterium]